MIRPRAGRIGLDRVVRLRWLAEAAALAETPNVAAKEILRERLRPHFAPSRPGTRSSLDKTLTVLSRVWLRPPEPLGSLRTRGVELLRAVAEDEKTAIHWGMVMAVYPFWGVVASTVGRLVGIQDFVSAKQIQRRIREGFGERETVSRRVRYVLRTYIDWGVLAEAGRRGLYATARPREVFSPGVIVWLVEAFLHAQRNRLTTFEAVLRSPSFFPFRLPTVSAQGLRWDETPLELIPQGTGQSLLVLRDRERRRQALLFGDIQPL